MTRHLAFDVGATRTRVAVVDADGSILGRHDRPTPTAGDGAVIADSVREAGLAACRTADAAPGAIERAAVATVAAIDRDRGGVVDPANFPPAVDFVPFVDALGDLADEVLLCNDATAAALGERAADDAPDDLAYLSISTGIGAGVVSGGRVLAGHRGNAGEVGHLTLDPEGALRCGCGGAGHWEAYCSGEGIPRYARYLAAEVDLDIETDLPQDDLDAPAVFAAVGDDPLADAVIERVAEWNTRGVAAIVRAYDPAVIAVGGAVALENTEHVVEPVRTRLPGALHVTTPPEIRLTSLGDDVVLRGAIERAVAGEP